MAPGPRLRLLAALQTASGVTTVLSGVFGPAAAANRAAIVLLGVIWIVLGICTALVVRVRSWSVDASLAISTLLLAAATYVADEPSVQVLNGLAMALLGVFAAYFLPLRRVAAFLCLSVVSFLLAIGMNAVLDSPWIALGVVGMLVFNTCHVAYLVNRLRAASLVDPLTSALNRHGLEIRAPGVRAVAQRAGGATTVCLLDLDDFKSVNDRHGHAAGDQVLIDLVQAWSGLLRPSDQLARVGGDEFVLVLPNCDVAGARRLLERLRRASPIEWSAGAVPWEPSDPDVFSAIRRADAAMYRAKRGQAWDGEPPLPGPAPSPDGSPD